MKVKKLLALGLAAMMTVSLAACGGGSSDSSSSDGASSDSASSEGGGELNVWLEKILPMTLTTQWRSVSTALRRSRELL